MVVSAETSGEARVAVAGNYLLKALRACGGIAEMKLASSKSPIVFTVDGYRCLVMPMNLPESKTVAEAEAIANEREAKAETQPEKKAEGKPKRKGKGKARQHEVEPEEVTETEEEREPVAVS